MSVEAWALFVGLFINALAVFFGLWANKRKIQHYHDQVNGCMDQLLEEVRSGSIAKGRKLESDEREHKNKA